MLPKSSPNWSPAAFAQTSSTDQTSAHDPIHGYLPKGWSVAEWRAKQESDPKGVEKAARASMRDHVEAMVGFPQDGHSDPRLWQQYPPDGAG